MTICVPWSQAHDAPEHLRLTLNGGKDIKKSDSAHGGRKNSDERDAEVERLLKRGLSGNSIAALLHMSDRRISQIKHELDYVESTKGAI